MSDYLLQHEVVLRAGSFAAILLLMMLAEWLAPRRSRAIARSQRWPTNLGLVVFNTLLLRILPFMAATSVALQAEQQHWGLFNLLELPLLPSVILSLILLDALIYWQHRLFHAVPVLWRLHRVHHSDPDLDVTSGGRFHPVEILMSMLIKMLAVVLLGVPLLALILFEILLNGLAMFNHSNVAIPASIDSPLRRLIVTPDMHRIHHSVVPEETNSNYGFNLSCWDRLFGSYTEAPAAGQLGMSIGLRGFANDGMIALLLQPKRK